MNEFSSNDWYQQAYNHLIQGEYSQATCLYEQAIQVEPHVKSHYWYLGLGLLLQGQETEAQTTWLLAMVEGKPEQVELWTTELTQVLQIEAERREVLEDYSVAWVIRQHLREISPSDIKNLLQLIQLSIQLHRFTGKELTNWDVIQKLQSETGVKIDPDLVLQVLQKVFDYALLESLSLELLRVCLPYVNNSQDLINVVLPTAMKVAYHAKQPKRSASFVELCLRLDPENTELLRQLAIFYQDSRQYHKGIKTARLCYSLVKTLPEQIFANHLVLRGLMNASGYWQEAVLTLNQQESLLLSLFKQPFVSLDQATTLRLLTSTFFLPYFRDSLAKNRCLYNQVAQLCQAIIQTYAQEQADKYRQRRLARKGNPDQPLKIGYLSNSLGRHSVGWLSRWVFHYYDRNQFDVYLYFVSHQTYVNDDLQNWIMQQVDHVHKLGANSLEIAEQIYGDEIDILVDLDSITLDISSEVMALKPAPIQVTWLGWDASGLPAIDYFIADPYVLPDSAQKYYTEKIWRLPETYIAVDGFEVGVPSLRRDQLGIPSDAIAYLTAQTGYKRHPDTLRLQMRIIKQVPNSYFLIKGLGDQEALKNLFAQIAAEEGVESNRLRFLPWSRSEEIHRADLTIADIALDTYPYNGATTTLEILWMGIPIVTRVGEQFAARNSYTMMMNAGVTEGIAWTDEEYVEWGVRLGKDPAWRQQIAGKLQQSRQTAPLWNARQFTRELEAAYEQMWTRYLDNRHSR